MGAEGDLMSSAVRSETSARRCSRSVDAQEASVALSGMEVDDRAVDELLKEALQKVAR
jgi:hypothetical protein